MKNLKFTLLVLILLLGVSAAQSQVVQYEYKQKYAYHKGKYAVLQVDYTKKRFVYRMSCDGLLAGDCIAGYVEMYGVLREKEYLNPIYLEMEIYDWLYMDLNNGPFYKCRLPQKEHIDEGNPKMVLHRDSNDSVIVMTSNSFENKYPKFYSEFRSSISSTMYHTKKVKLDKKMYGKELYKYVIKENEKIIYNDEIFSPYADFFTRIYLYRLHPMGVGRN